MFCPDPLGEGELERSPRPAIRNPGGPTSNGRGEEKRRGWEIEGTACCLVNLWRGLAGFGRLGGELFAGAEGGWTPVSVGCVQHVYCVESGDDVSDSVSVRASRVFS